MMIHRCSDNGWRNGRLTPLHANEGEMQRMQAVYPSDERPGVHRKSTPETGTVFHLGGYKHAKVTWKINTTTKQTHVLPSGIRCQLKQVCLRVQAYPLKLQTMQIHFHSRTSTSWHLRPRLSSAVAWKVSNWRRTGCFATLHGCFHISSYPLSTPHSHPTILISMGYLFYSLQIGSLALLAEVWRETGESRTVGGKR